jgi:hypothetical protein
MLLSSVEIALPRVVRRAAVAEEVGEAGEAGD